MTPAAALLDRLLDIVVTTELDQPGRISLASGWQCSLSRSASCLPPSGARVTAGYGLAGNVHKGGSRHMRHPASHASSHGFGAAMTDDDMNEETARPAPNDALPAI